MRMMIVTCGLLAACAPGSFEWSSGDDLVRTALYQRIDVGVPGTRVLVSTGIFDCDLPQEDDPAAAAQALLDLTISACREDARHLAITTWHDPDVGVTGRYVGQDDALPSNVTPQQPRLTRVDYVGIEEAVLVSSDLPQFGAALGPPYRPTEVTQEFASGTNGEVRLRDGTDHISGRFDFPELNISGTFRARECQVGATLFDLAFASPTATCP